MLARDILEIFYGRHVHLPKEIRDTVYIVYALMAMSIIINLLVAIQTKAWSLSWFILLCLLWKYHTKLANFAAMTWISLSVVLELEAQSLKDQETMILLPLAMEQVPWPLVECPICLEPACPAESHIVAVMTSPTHSDKCALSVKRGGCHAQCWNKLPNRKTCMLCNGPIEKMVLCRPLQNRAPPRSVNANVNI